MPGHKARRIELLAVMAHIYSASFAWKGCNALAYAEEKDEAYSLVVTLTPTTKESEACIRLTRSTLRRDLFAAYIPALRAGTSTRRRNGSTHRLARAGVIRVGATAHTRERRRAG
ncbi:hypothetical protein F4780DRAFT_739679 [Xylariomycetidae sp. FL0641]|nr:hypothetical protein F4780DRAFT_739679 [Xylariomycetidae sp. FL0641]